MFCVVYVVLTNYQPLLQLLADVMGMTAKVCVCVCVCTHTHTHTHIHKQHEREFAWGGMLPELVEYHDSVYLFTAGMCRLLLSKNNG